MALLWGVGLGAADCIETVLMVVVVLVVFWGPLGAFGSGRAASLKEGVDRGGTRTADKISRVPAGRQVDARPNPKGPPRSKNLKKLRHLDIFYFVFGLSFFLGEGDTKSAPIFVLPARLFDVYRKKLSGSRGIAVSTPDMLKFGHRS